MDPGAHQHIEEMGTFAVNVRVQVQLNIAFMFFNSAKREGGVLNGQPLKNLPVAGFSLLTAAHMCGEWNVVAEIVHGVSTVFVGEIVETGIGAEKQAVLIRDHSLNYPG